MNCKRYPKTPITCLTGSAGPKTLGMHHWFPCRSELFKRLHCFSITPRLAVDHGRSIFEPATAERSGPHFHSGKHQHAQRSPRRQIATQCQTTNATNHSEELATRSNGSSNDGLKYLKGTYSVVLGTLFVSKTFKGETVPIGFQSPKWTAKLRRSNPFQPPPQGLPDF